LQNKVKITNGINIVKAQYTPERDIIISYKINKIETSHRVHLLNKISPNKHIAIFIKKGCNSKYYVKEKAPKKYKTKELVSYIFLL
jgi:hypothetical protein